MSDQGVLHTDAHMFAQPYFYQSKPDVVADIMTQLSLKVVLREWGDKAHTAATSEMKQLCFSKMFIPMYWKKLTRDQRLKVLESHMFLKKKRIDGNIKRRTVAGGNKQRSYIPKGGASLPTVATKAVLLTCIIDAGENRDVSIIDITNAFIQMLLENGNDKAFIVIRGILVDILFYIYPHYKLYVTRDKKGVK